MKVLLVSSPRYYWPYMNEDDNFLLPQSLVCLAAVLREAGIQVKILDCMASKIGWKSRGRPERTRLCTHYGIEREDIEAFIEGLTKLI